MTAAELALQACRAQAASLPGEWPLTLHMLEGHAPRFFAKHNLAAELNRALDGLDAMPLDLDTGLAPETAMDRIDARWLKAKRGRAVPPLDVARANACLDFTLVTAGILHAWLMGELLGLSRPYTSLSPMHDLYWLTHRVLLNTDYLARPLRGLDDVLDQLQAAVPELQSPEHVDILGEALFCLQSGGRDVRAEVERFVSHQAPDGSFGDAHATAVGLVVLAHEVKV